MGHRPKCKTQHYKTLRLKKKKTTTKKETYERQAGMAQWLSGHL